jgi:adenylate cyclase class IV
MSGDKLGHFKEFETKYCLDGDKVFEFKQLVENLGEQYDFIYVQGPDHYYTKPDGSFLRYRKADNDKTGRAELTMKTKPTGASHNILRKEINLRVDKNSFNTIEEFASMLGYSFNFKIWKMCHIYKFKDVTLVFYTVRDEKSEMTHFVEIEIDEDLIPKLTEEEAWNIIRKYERVLSPLGITHRHRLNKSLFEMYYMKNNESKLVSIMENA